MIRAATWLVSFALHAVLVAVSLNAHVSPDTSSFEAGAGDASFVIEQGMGIEGFMQEGTAVETVEANEAPQEFSEARPQVDEVKPVEETVISSADGPSQDDIPVEKPPEEVKREQPPQVATIDQSLEVAVEEQRSAGQKQEGGDTGVRRAYLGKLVQKLQRSKVNPHSRSSGTVMVRFAVAPSGALLSKEIVASSGSQVLDDAALAAVDKAAPFPPFPDTLKVDKIVEVVPYRFTVR